MKHDHRGRDGTAPPCPQPGQASQAPTAVLALALATTALATMALPAAATPLPADALERRCWLESTRERTRVNLREPTGVDFALLADGMRVRTPFAVDFAVRGLGVAPAGVALPGTGHHHVLVNRALPLDVRAPLPFDDSHRHFGKGQTGTLLNLPPGRHRLRLLFADHEHRPYFVYSREITVEVAGPRNATPRPRIDPERFAETCAAWYADEVSSPPAPDAPLRVLNLRAGEPVTSPFNLRFGVDGFGVCATPPDGTPAPPQTGRFALEVYDAGGSRVAVPELAHGATQANLFLPAGSYGLRLRFVDPLGRDLLPPKEMPVRVTRADAI